MILLGPGVGAIMAGATHPACSNVCVAGEPVSNWAIAASIVGLVIAGCLLTWFARQIEERG